MYYKVHGFENYLENTDNFFCFYPEAKNVKEALLNFLNEWCDLTEEELQDILKEFNKHGSIEIIEDFADRKFTFVEVLPTDEKDSRCPYCYGTGRTPVYVPF